MLGPPDRVTESRRSVAPRVIAQGFGDLQEQVARDTARLLNGFGRIAREVTLDYLEHTAWVLKGMIEFLRSYLGSPLGLRLAAEHLPLFGRRWDLDPLVLPGLDLVLPRVLVPSREEPVEVFRVPKILGHDCGCVRVADDVIAKVTLVGDDVVDDPTEKGDVGPGPNRNMDVGHRARSGKAWIYVNDLRAPTLRLHGPAESHRVTFGHI